MPMLPATEVRGSTGLRAAPRSTCTVRKPIAPPTKSFSGASAGVSQPFTVQIPLRDVCCKQLTPGIEHRFPGLTITRSVRPP
jgi:hypothetical protein